MNEADWYDDFPVIGKLSDDEAAEKLREINNNESVSPALDVDETVDPSVSFGVWDSVFGVPAWKHTSHTFGYIPPLSKEQDIIPIQHISQLDPDERLKTRVSLLRLMDCVLLIIPEAASIEYFSIFMGKIN